MFGILRKLWGSPAFHRATQAVGVNLVPVNFYSNVPSVAEIEDSFEYKGDAPPYLDSKAFDEQRLRTTLEMLIPYAVDFNPDIDGDEATCANGFFWKNSQFSWSDAMAYHAFLRALQPANVVEIGGGFSSLIARQALQLNGRGKVTCIEPFPRPFLRDQPDIALRQKPIQDVSSDDLNAILQDGDVLFIDSTHTVKSGSDCLHIYLRLLPKLERNVYIHVHDIFLPFAMPKEWLLRKRIFWTEQYLLLAWLLGNPNAKLIYGSNYHSHFNTELLDRLMRGRYGAGGSSVWIKFEPMANARLSNLF